MIFLIIAIASCLGLGALMDYVDRVGNKHRCNEWGDCEYKCPWCKTYGFAAYQNDQGREYLMCKWCGKFQNIGGKVEQCKREICPSCYPFYKKLETTLSVKNLTRMLGSRNKNTMKELYLTWTGQPGHPCAVCSSKMVEFNPNLNPAQLLKEDLYKYHGYKK